MVSEAIVELFHTNGSLVFGGSARICWFAFLRAPLTVSGKPTWALGSRKFWPARTSSGANSPKSSWEATSRGRRDDARPVPAFISHAVPGSDSDSNGSDGPTLPPYPDGAYIVSLTEYMDFLLLENMM